MDKLASIKEQDHTEDGSIPQGFVFASIKNVGKAAATVNGVKLEPGQAKAYAFVGKGYQSVPFTTGGSVLRILQIV